MTTKRRTLRRGGRGCITPEAVAAWQACDYLALHSAFSLTPWQHSPLPVEVICLGVSQDSPPDFLDAPQREDWRKAQALQRQLLEAAGWPDCRHVYRENLAEALQWQRYCEEEMDHCSHQGTGSDLASRRRKLREAKDDVAYRKRLLAELEDKA
jgi:hypothetical protein